MKPVQKSEANWLAIKIQNAVVEAWTPYMKGQVYDLGCGTMPYRDFVQSVGCSYVGVDWPMSLHGAQPDVVADLNAPFPIESQIADTVTAISVLEHIKEPLQFLRESHRILRPNGHMLLQVPFQWWIHEAPHDYFRYTIHGLQYLFSQAGFQNVVVTANTGLWTTLVLKLNYRTIPLARRSPWVRRGLQPFWYVGQSLAPILDAKDPHDSETASYSVVASRGA